MFCIGADEGTRKDSFLAVRVHYLNSEMQPKSKFWQTVKLYDKGHHAIVQAILDSLTKSPEPERIPEERMLTKEHVAKALVGLTADGAPVMGTQRSGAPLAAATRGPTGNLAWSLQQLKREQTEEKLFVVWCSPHGFDLVAEALEDLPVCAPVLSMVRRLCSHVANHAKARGTLKELHILFTATAVGGLASLRFAPHRFLSHAGPAAVICDSFSEVLTYVHVILHEHRVEVRDRDAGLFAWAQAMRIELQPLKTWLLLAVAADILAILRKANLKTQRDELRVLMVTQIIDACLLQLEAYIGEDGVLRRSLASLGQPQAPPGKGPHIESVCRMLHLKRRGGSLTVVHELSEQDN